MEDGRQKIVGEIPELPPLPRIAQMVLQEINREDVEIPRLSKVIEQDPGLLARIVGIANSSYYASPSRIYTISDAIIKVLGLRMVESLAMGIVLNSPLTSARCKGFQLDQYWFSSMHTACLARGLSEHLQWERERAPEHAYLCGLLHNLGTLVLVYSFPGQMEEVFANSAQSDPAEVVLLERERVGLSYPEAGSILAQKWGLPEEVIAVTGNHHTPEYRGDHWRLSALVGLCAHAAVLDSDEIAANEKVREYVQALEIEMAAVECTCVEMLARKQEIIGMACVLSLD